MATRSDTRPIRHIEVKPTHNGEYFWHVTDRKREILYTSETFIKKHGAITAAKREHEGRSRFRYVLEYRDERRNRDVVLALN